MRKNTINSSFDVKKFYKKFSSIILSLSILFGSSVVSFALALPQSEYDAVCKNYTYAGPADSSYNCLAYALGITNQWVWPWGSTNPTDNSVTSYLNMWGYTKGNYVHQPVIMSHGTSTSSIAHFSKASGSNSYSKFGAYELFYHNGWDVFRGIYGNLKSVYY